MEICVQMVGLALVATCCCLVIRGQAGVLAVLLSLIACIMIYSTVLSLFFPVMELFQSIRELTGLEQAVTSPMLKVAGIGVVSQIASTVCDDAGEKALGRAVEIGCTLLALHVSIPLLSAVLDLLKDILGGAG